MFLKSKNILLIGLFLCLAFPAVAQESFRVMFWNVENLFDTKDDLRKNDNEFLPDATRHWNHFRYREKLKKLAKGVNETVTAIFNFTQGFHGSVNKNCIVPFYSIFMQKIKYVFLCQHRYLHKIFFFIIYHILNLKSTVNIFKKGIDKIIFLYYNTKAVKERCPSGLRSWS